MGRERQKKKNRSSIHKVRQKPKSKKINIKSNPIIAANWDSTQTLSQNYRRLGLLSKLNAPTGGTEKKVSSASADETDDPIANNPLSIKRKIPTTIEPSEVRIERDPETGAILRVLRPEDPKTSNPLNDLLNPVTEQKEESRSGSKGVVPLLEEQAAIPEKKTVRKQSQQEQEWIQALVSKHGDDYEAMFRDRKLNPMQQSVGDLKRRVKKWNCNK